MRPFALMVLAIAVEFPLAAQSGPAVSPNEITLRAGDTAILKGYQHPGGLSCGFPYHYEFFSDAPAVAAVHGLASGSSVCHPDDNGDVYVTAVSPGIAHVRVAACCGDLSTITVLPQLLPVEIRADAVRVLAGQQIVLTAVVPGYEGAPWFSWYRGRLGDSSHPIRTSFDPHLAINVTDAGMSYIWVYAFAGPRASSDEIAIEIIQPRRRAAGH